MKDRPLKNFRRLKVLAKHPQPSKNTYLRPAGFPTAAAEYDFFYERESSRAFECPDGGIRVVSALNYYWEAISIIEHELGASARQIAAEAWTLTVATASTDAEYESLFGETLLMQIEDYMDEFRTQR